MMIHHNFISIFFLNNDLSVPLKAPFVNYFQDDFAGSPPPPCAAAFSFYHLSFCVMFVNSTVVAFFRFSLFRCNLYVCSWKVLVGGSLTFLPLEPCNFQERKPLEKKKKDRSRKRNRISEIDTMYLL